jgi:hypothetical protein
MGVMSFNHEYQNSTSDEKNIFSEAKQDGRKKPLRPQKFQKHYFQRSGTHTKFAAISCCYKVLFNVFHKTLTIIIKVIINVK